MKKLFLFTLLLPASISFAQQSKTAQSNNIAVQQPQGHTYTQSGPLKNMMLPITATTLTSCMSVDLPTPTTWTLVNYTSGTGGSNGFANGVNGDDDMEKARYFDASTTAYTRLNQVYVGFGIAYSAPAYTNTPVNMKIYDGTSGTPGTLLGTAAITVGEIMGDVTANRYSSFIFNGGIALPASKKFFASVDVSNLTWNFLPKDSLSIVSNVNGQTNPTDTWEKWSDASWHKYMSANSYSLNISLLIHPFLSTAPIQASITPSSSSICSGKSITYNSAGSTTGGVNLWGFTAAATATASGNPASFTYPTAGTYTTTLVITDACNAVAYTQQTVSVIPSPTVTASASSSLICSGAAVTFNGGGASTYAWTGGVTNGVAFNPTGTTTYTVTGAAANTCTNTAMVTVSVNTTPTVGGTAASNNFCAGGSTTLNGSGASTYTWTGGVTNGVAFNPTGTTTYTVMGATNNCTNSAQVTVTVLPLPTVTGNASAASVCAGVQTTLNGSGSSTYTWTGGVTNGVAFTPSTSGTYTVTGTAVNGCTNSAVASVTVNALPSVTANATSTNVCSGGQATLSGGGASTYTWTGGVTNGVAFTPSASGTYTVTGTSATSCTNTAVITVSVVSAPVISATASNPVICNGSTTTLNGGGASTYTWTGGVTDGVPFSPTSTGSYTVSASAPGCPGTYTAAVTVSVNPLPVVTANTSTNVVCAGIPVTLTAAGATTYTWTSGVTNGVAFIPTITNTYTVSASSSNCLGTFTAAATVTVNPSPTLTAVSSTSMLCSGNSATLTISGTATSYSLNNVTIPATAVVSPTTTTTYTVTGVNASGCSKTTTVTQNVTVCTGIDTHETEADILVAYPNPSNGSFNLKATKEQWVIITNELGQTLRTIHLTSASNFEAPVNGFASGIYFVITETSKHKLVVTH